MAACKTLPRLSEVVRSEVEEEEDECPLSPKAGTNNPDRGTEGTKS